MSRKATREQQSLADQASMVVGRLLRRSCCRHERKCGCFGRFRASSWLALDALINEGWQLVPPAASVGERDA